MGQYYKPISLEKRQFVFSHNYDCGLKLMEHSYVGNNFVNIVENLIAEGGDWHGNRILWAGDYADADKGRQKNVHDIIGINKNKINPAEKQTKYKYFINMDTKEFVDMSKIPPTFTGEDDGKKWTMEIHPLPLMTCEGNNRGGGDFRGDERDMVGIWSRNRVSVTNKKPEGYKEFIFDLIE